MLEFGPDVKTKEPPLSAADQQVTGHLWMPQSLFISLLDGLYTGTISMELGSPGQCILLCYLQAVGGGKKPSIFFIYNLFLTERWFQRNLSQGAWCWLYALYRAALFHASHLSSQNGLKANLTSLRGMGWGVGCPSGCCRWWECPWSVPGHDVLERSWLLLDFQVQDSQYCKGYLKLLSAYASTFLVGLPDQWRVPMVLWDPFVFLKRAV